MASTTFIPTQSRQSTGREQIATTEAARPIKPEVIFVPTLFDLSGHIDMLRPVINVVNVFQWRRQAQESVAALVSGAVSLR